ncbi:ABC transporter substrate-binding protein, partial [Agrobacterium sp. S2]|nr:ABC transporter substrate-binding protein [Agrobacterium sp. S2]MBM7330685.1 ABC transporter substrate-binding protein [Agrobacterium sp. S2]
PDPTLRPENKELVEKFKAAGFNPEAYTLYSYAALQAIAGAAKAAGSVEPEKVAEALKKGSFPTALGEISFDEKGDPKLPGYVMYEWKKGPDGKFTYIQQGS